MIFEQARDLIWKVFFFPSTTDEKQEVRRAILSCSLDYLKGEEAYEDRSDDDDDENDDDEVI